MYYINSFFIFSVIGFIMESTIYKLFYINKHSGIFFGPITAVYGVGVVAILLLNRYFFSKLKVNIILKLIIMFIVLTSTLTLIEFLGGNILNFLFNIDMWNYSHKSFNYGKYICLELSLIWGIFGILFIYILKPFMDRFIKIIPKFATYLFIFIFMIDIIFVLLFK